LTKRMIIFGIIALFVLSFSVFYPQPDKLVVTVKRFFDPPISYPQEIDYLLEASFGKSPAWIEEYVKEEIPYRYDWQNYNYPLYFPTVKEVLDKESGDCKSRLAVLASIFSFYEIPYSVCLSASHVWLDYENRISIGKERRELVFIRYDQESFTVRKPSVDWQDSGNTFKEANWDYMPMGKKMSLAKVWLSCLFFILASNLGRIVEERRLLYVGNKGFSG
jgi:hypothetical protein